MDKQYYVLVDHKDHNISWQKGEVVMLNPDLALPHLGIHLVPLYSAIKSGLYKPDLPKEPLLAKIIEDVKELIAPAPTPVATPAMPDSNDVITEKPTNKKLLQNKLQAQILAKKSELAKNKNNS